VIERNVSVCFRDELRGGHYNALLPPKNQRLTMSEEVSF
jgi:hypothetical protein